MKFPLRKNINEQNGYNRPKEIVYPLKLPHHNQDVEFVQAVQDVREGEARPCRARDGRGDQRAPGAAAKVLAGNV